MKHEIPHIPSQEVKPTGVPGPEAAGSQRVDLNGIIVARTSEDSDRNHATFDGKVVDAETGKPRYEDALGALDAQAVATGHVFATGKPNYKGFAFKQSDNPNPELAETYVVRSHKPVKELNPEEEHRLKGLGFIFSPDGAETRRDRKHKGGHHKPTKTVKRHARASGTGFSLRRPFKKDYEGNARIPIASNTELEPVVEDTEVFEMDVFDHTGKLIYTMALNRKQFGEYIIGETGAKEPGKPLSPMSKAWWTPGSHPSEAPTAEMGAGTTLPHHSIEVIDIPEGKDAYDTVRAFQRAHELDNITSLKWQKGNATKRIVGDKIIQRETPHGPKPERVFWVQETRSGVGQLILEPLPKSAEELAKELKGFKRLFIDATERPLQDDKLTPEQRQEQKTAITEHAEEYVDEIQYSRGALPNPTGTSAEKALHAEQEKIALFLLTSDLQTDLSMDERERRIHAFMGKPGESERLHKILASDQLKTLRNLPSTTEEEVAKKHSTMLALQKEQAEAQARFDEIAKNQHWVEGVRQLIAEKGVAEVVDLALRLDKDLQRNLEAFNIPRNESRGYAWAFRELAAHTAYTRMHSTDPNQKHPAGIELGTLIGDSVAVRRRRRQIVNQMLGKEFISSRTNTKIHRGQGIKDGQPVIVEEEEKTVKHGMTELLPDMIKNSMILILDKVPIDKVTTKDELDAGTMLRDYAGLYSPVTTRAVAAAA